MIPVEQYEYVGVGSKIYWKSIRELAGKPAT